jgi:hypothetical protein
MQLSQMLLLFLILKKMNNKSTYNISQDYEIIQPKKGKVYPILFDEWVFIKIKIKEIKININYYNTIGSILIGASLSFLATNLTTEFKSQDTHIICWAIFAVTAICGILLLIFGESKRKEVNTKPIDILKQMELIETRYEKQEEK